MGWMITSRTGDQRKDGRCPLARDRKLRKDSPIFGKMRPVPVKCQINYCRFSQAAWEEESEATANQEAVIGVSNVILH